MNENFVLTGTQKRLIDLKISELSQEDLRRIKQKFIIGDKEEYYKDEMEKMKLQWLGNSRLGEKSTRVMTTEEELNKLLNFQSKPYSDEPKQFSGTRTEVTRKIMMTLYCIGAIIEKIEPSSTIKKTLEAKQSVIENGLMNGGDISVSKTGSQYQLSIGSLYNICSAWGLFDYKEKYCGLGKYSLSNVKGGKGGTVIVDFTKKSLKVREGKGF